MKVLIVGEFSAFAKNLAQGINSVENCEAVVFSYEDGFKKVSQDSKSYTYKRPYNYTIFGKELRGTHMFTGYRLYKEFKKNLKGYHHYFDAAFIISYTLLRKENNHTLPQFSKSDILYAVKDSQKIFMSACGGDLPFFEFALNDKRFSTVYKNKVILNNPLYQALEKEALFIVRGVIPMSYQYHEAYRCYGEKFRLFDPVPLPFTASSVKAKNSYYSNGNIVIFNGALRPSKGSVFIDEAVQRIKEKYGDRIIIRNDRLPYNKFLEFLREIDIYIDLCTDYDYGMSAIAAMLAGCVVLSGNTIETRRCMGTDSIPVVSIDPDSDQIFTAIENLILNPQLIEEIGMASVIYAQTRHDSKLLASTYLNAFK